MSHMPRVSVTVSGAAGTGKSRVLAEIEVALRAAGISIEWATPGDQTAAKDDQWSIAGSEGPVVTEWPVVVLGEVDLPSVFPPAPNPSDLPPAQARALDWLPGDGSWQHEPKIALVRAGLQGLLSSGRAVQKLNTGKDGLTVAFWRLTVSGLALKRERIVAGGEDGR